MIVGSLLGAGLVHHAQVDHDDHSRRTVTVRSPEPLVNVVRSASITSSRSPTTTPLPKAGLSVLRAYIGSLVTAAIVSPEAASVKIFALFPEKLGFFYHPLHISQALRHIIVEVEHGKIFLSQTQSYVWVLLANHLAQS